MRLAISSSSPELARDSSVRLTSDFVRPALLQPSPRAVDQAGYIVGEGVDQGGKETGVVSGDLHEALERGRLENRGAARRPWWFGVDWRRLSADAGPCPEGCRPCRDVRAAAAQRGCELLHADRLAEVVVHPRG